MTASLPNIRRPAAMNVELGTQAMPSQRAIDWLQVVSARVPADVEAEGTLAGHFTYQSDSNTGWDGQLQATGLSLKSAHAGLSPLTIGDLTLESASQADTVVTPSSRKSPHAKPPATTQKFLLAHTTLDLGGKDPATIDGSFDTGGYTLHLTGMIALARLTALGNTIPQLGDGLKDILPTNRAAGPVRLDLTATRKWGAPQVWQDSTLTPPPTHPRKHPR